MVSQILIPYGLESHFLVNSVSTKLLLSNSSFASQFSKKMPLLLETHEWQDTRLKLDTQM